MIFEQHARPKLPRNKYGSSNGASYTGASYVQTGSAAAQNAVKATLADRATTADGADKLNREVDIFGNSFDGTQDLFDADIQTLCASTLTVQGDASVHGVFKVNNVQPVSGRTVGIGGMTVTTGGLATLTSVSAESVSSKTVDASTLKAGEATVRNLTVTGSAHFFNLVVDEVKAAGGQIILSAADFQVDMVADHPNPPLILTSTSNAQQFSQLVTSLKAHSSNSSVRTGKIQQITVYSHRAYQLGQDDEGNTIYNKWQQGDLAYCQRLNMADANGSDVDAKWYWQPVSMAGSTTVSGQRYLYIDIATHIIVQLKDSPETITLRANPNVDGDMTPSVGDKIALLGSLNDAERRDAIVMAAYKCVDTDITCPAIVQYKGIDWMELRADNRYNVISGGGNTFRGSLKVDTGETVQELIDSKINVDVQTYQHVAYADSADGSTGFATTPVADHQYGYIGFCVTSSSVAPQTPSSYRWVMLNGDAEDWSYACMVFTAKYAAVNKDDTMTASARLNVYRRSKDGMTDIGQTESAKISVYCTTDISSTRTPLARQGTAYVLTDTVSGWHTSSNPKWYDITLAYDGVVVQTERIEVVFAPGAAMQVVDDIKTYVQDSSGRISSLQQTAAGIQAYAADVSGNLSKLSLSSNAIDLRVQSLEQGLGTTGINITDGTIEMQADNFVLTNGDDEEVLTADSSGNLSVTGNITADFLRLRYSTADPSDPNGANATVMQGGYLPKVNPGECVQVVYHRIISTRSVTTDVISINPNIQRGSIVYGDERLWLYEVSGKTGVYKTAPTGGTNGRPLYVKKELYTILDEDQVANVTLHGGHCVFWGTCDPATNKAIWIMYREGALVD